MDAQQETVELREQLKNLEHRHNELLIKFKTLHEYVMKQLPTEAVGTQTTLVGA